MTVWTNNSVRAFAFCVAMICGGCQSVVVIPGKAVPVNIQEAIAQDLFELLRAELQPTQFPVNLSASNAGEERLETLLRHHGYQVQQGGELEQTRLAMYRDDRVSINSKDIYVASLNIGSFKRLTREYQVGSDGIEPVGVITLGE